MGQPETTKTKAYYDGKPRVRSYDDVLSRIVRLPSDSFELQKYGEVERLGEKYPLYRIVSKNFAPNKPSVLITSGVHGYEDGAVEGGIRFLEEKAQDYTDKYNLIYYPVIHPFGFEYDTRHALRDPKDTGDYDDNRYDVNRQFVENPSIEEVTRFKESLESLPTQRFLIVMDLHETPAEDAIIMAANGQNRAPNPDSYVYTAATEISINAGAAIVKGFNKAGIAVMQQNAGVKAYVEHEGEQKPITEVAPGALMSYFTNAGLAEIAVTTETSWNYDNMLSIGARANGQVQGVCEVLDYGLTLPS